MRMFSTCGTSALVATLLLAGCASRPTSPGPGPRTPAAPPVVRSIAVSPAQYVAAASSASLFIIKASEQIAAREGDTGLGRLAQQFRSEQEGVGAQLSFAGRRLNLLPSAVLLPREQAMLVELSASLESRATYLRQVKRVIAETLALHRQYERYGTSPTLRPVAAMAAPVFDRQLRAIGRI